MTIPYLRSMNKISIEDLKDAAKFKVEHVFVADWKSALMLVIVAVTLSVVSGLIVNMLKRVTNA